MEAGARWRVFVEHPSTHAHPGRIAACFDGAVSEDACSRLQAASRLHPRLTARLVAHFKLPPLDTDIDGATRDAVLAAIDDPEGLILRCGAIYWSASLTETILGHVAARLQDELGEELYTLAVRNRDLAGPRRQLEPLDNLRPRVVADGTRCFLAWLGSQAAGLRERVLLRFADTEVTIENDDPAFIDLCRKIVQRAAA